MTPPDRLVFTFAWEEPDGGSSPETLVTVSLEDLGERTRLTLHQAFFADPAVRDEHTVGWTSAIERLAEYIAADSMS